jgi:hypothetical protein
MDNNEKKTDSEWKKRELGVLWKKDGKSQKFYSGFFKINKGQEGEKEIPIVIFLNKLKQNPKAPDLIIYESKDKGVNTDHDQIPDSFLE